MTAFAEDFWPLNRFDLISCSVQMNGKHQAEGVYVSLSTALTLLSTWQPIWASGWSRKVWGPLALLLAEDIVEALHPRSKAHCLKKQVHNFQLWGQALRLP